MNPRLDVTGAFDWKFAPKAEFAVIGDPVAHSLSPRMHQAIYAALGLPFRYVAIRVASGDVGEGMDRLLNLGYLGVNVTVPHKREILDWAIDAEAFAIEVQAANTVELETRKCINTDAPGFLKTLEQFDFANRRALVLGAGGSARALVAALSQSGWKVAIFNRSRGNAVELASRHAAELMDNPDPEGASLILNTTSAAFSGEAPPVLWERAAPHAVAYDLMYSKDSTPFLVAAQARGILTMDGLPLLIAQGALAFEWWTGRTAPLAAMEAAVRQAF